MLANSKTQWLAIALSLLTMRVVIGWHFYTEGVSKLKSGQFSAEPFFRSAKGPLADAFLRLIPDYDGRLRLGLVVSSDDPSGGTWELDPLVTEEIWRGFAYRTSRIRGYGDPQLASILRQRESDIQIQIDRARSSGVDRNTLGELESRLAVTKTSLRSLAAQKSEAMLVIDRYVTALRTFLADNKSEILAYFRGAERARGFDRDGPFQAAVVQGVRSLQSQTESIEAERARNVREWLSEVNAMWSGVEADINALAIPDQAGRYVKIDAPHESPWSPLPWINRVIPWFDVIVGGCLILGLFTRIASLAGAGFLLSIVATQPPWVAGAAPTTYQWIELVGLMVLFACHAGLYAGLDVFFYQRTSRRRVIAPEPAI